MRHFLLKFNHGVEIGARLAYLGHYDRTKDSNILDIANEELDHKLKVRYVLGLHNESPSTAIDTGFTIVGNIIKFLCKFCPIWSLDLVARSMEMFAVVNYRRLAIMYPEARAVLTSMSEAEKRHETFFSKKA